MRLFSLDSPFMEGMRKLADVIILNVLFCACSIPVITIGASWAALTESVRILADDSDNGLIFIDFFKAFVKYFKKAILFELFIVIFIAGLRIYQRAIELMDGTMAKAYTITLYVLVFLFIFFIQFLFPVLVEQGGSVLDITRKTILLSVGRFPFVILSIIVVIISIGLSYMIFLQSGYSVAAIWLLAGFGLVAYFNQIIYGWAVKKKRNDEVSDIQ